MAPVPYEKLADQPATSDPAPVALRDTAKISQSAGAATPRIGEETAQSRAEGSGAVRPGSSVIPETGECGLEAAEIDGPNLRKICGEY